MDHSPAALGAVIRHARNELGLTQAELGDKAGYEGTGASISISRIERGEMRPSTGRLAQIATALGRTPDQLLAESAQSVAQGSGPRRGDVPTSLRERKAQTQSRHEKVTERVSQRARATEDSATAFSIAHDAARDNYFREFIRVAQTLEGAPVPDESEQADADHQDGDLRTLELRAISNGLADAIAGAAAGTVAGAAAGGAAAYATFSVIAALGTASTGTAISVLSGVAATNATLAALGGGTLDAGGTGVAGGAALLTGMVAAPAALLMGAGFYYAKRRRTNKEEQRLRDAVTAAESALDGTEQGYGSLIRFLQDATPICEYINIHGAHALKLWESNLPPEPRSWSDLDEAAQAKYLTFLDAAAAFVMLSGVQVSELLTSDHGSVQRMSHAIQDTLTRVRRTVEACF